MKPPFLFLSQHNFPFTVFWFVNYRIGRETFRGGTVTNWLQLLTFYLAKILHCKHCLSSVTLVNVTVRILAAPCIDWIGGHSTTSHWWKPQGNKQYSTLATTEVEQYHPHGLRAGLTHIVTFRLELSISFLIWVITSGSDHTSSCHQACQRNTSGLFIIRFSSSPTLVEKLIYKNQSLPLSLREDTRVDIYMGEELSDSHQFENCIEII